MNAAKLDSVSGAAECKHADCFRIVPRAWWCRECGALSEDSPGGLTSVWRQPKALESLEAARGALERALEREGMVLRRAIGALSDIAAAARDVPRILNLHAGRPEDENTR